MLKYIYKITNKVNGKVYIGQTFNLQQRLYKHSKRGPLYSDIKKFGIENFSMETLYLGEDYNEKEDYYINLYNARDPHCGYNAMCGGRFVEDSVPGGIDIELVPQLKYDLIYSKLPLTELAKKYNVPVSVVNNINHGYSHAEALEMYPLRYNPSTGVKARINEIYADLTNPAMEFEEICKKYNIERYTLLNINKGTNYHQKDVNYPIREFYLPKEIRDEIIRLLKETNLTGMEIAAKFDPNVVNKSTVYRLNSGQIWYDPNLTYPIRDLTVNSPIGR